MSQPDLAGLFTQARFRHQQGDLEGAAALYDRILQYQPASIAVLVNLGGVRYEQRKFAQALAHYDKAALLAPQDPGLALNRGHALRELNRPDAALAAFDDVLARAPQMAQAWTARGGILQRQRRLRDALASYDKALLLAPQDGEALNNSGVILSELGDPVRALEYLDAALALAPASWQAHNNRGNALRDLGRPQAALMEYDAALARNPGYAEAHYNRGDLLMTLRRHDEALASYLRAAEAEPDLPNLEGALLHARMQLCDWTDFAGRCAALLDKIDRGQPASAPFPLLSVPCTAAQQRRAAAAHMALTFATSPGAPAQARKNGRVRIGYVSADFRHHPSMQLAVQHFENHDRTRFETFAFSLSPGDGSAMRARAEKAFDHFLDCASFSDSAVARLLRDHSIDIAIDLDGLTQGGRPGVLLERPAPLQLGWLGYPGTLGSAHLDYIVADGVVVPSGAEAGYRERILRLPHCYQPNSRRPSIAPASRDEAGLPDEGVVFCAFNNPVKITPDIFAAWMNILAQVPLSVLWLRVDDETALCNLKRAATNAGIAPSRLIFAPHADHPAHFARLAAADIFLDTSPYNAHTTASDALWAGVPVVTLRGETFASRVAASLLHTVGLPELITDRLEDYEALALHLARTPTLLREIRDRLARNRTGTPLFDIDLFTRDFEAALLSLLDRA